VFGRATITLGIDPHSSYLCFNFRSNFAGLYRVFAVVFTYTQNLNLNLNQHSSIRTGITPPLEIQKRYDCMVPWLEWLIFQVAFTPNMPFTELN